MDCVSFSLSTMTAAFFASIPFSKDMLCTQNLGRVLSRGTSLRGSRSSLISLAQYEDIMVGMGSSLSGQAFAHRCYQEKYKRQSSNPQRTYYCSIDLGSCNHALLTGYWVAPDTVDGWGFVEAWISPTS